MSLLTLIQELWRFFKDYLVKIVLGAIFVGLLTSGGRYFLTNQQVEGQKEAYNHLVQVYSQEPAEFQFILTNADGTLFDNSFVFDEYFSSPEVIKQVEAETGIKFGRFVQDEQLLELFKTSQYRGGLSAVRNTSTNVITMRFLVGKNADENLKIAQAYFKLLQENRVPFAKNHERTIVTSPVKAELLDLNTVQNVAVPESVSGLGGPNAKSSIIFGIAGFMFGLILTTGLLFLLRLFKRTITYGFDYAWNMEDGHLMYHRQKQSKASDLEDLLKVPHVNHRLVVSQVNPESSFESANFAIQPLTYVNKLQDLDQSSNQVDDIVIMVYSNQTEKSWYNEQAALAHLYRVPVKIIHVI
ncbi:hypothetical protein [Vaginisenegalia massiliensis]|uniref:hypothetical protein n=1 Tax=Vaginisenegalia massiliensis TaxID=2058294 RepID=UPI000F52D981|nr:hypothetical protein [Vaginisenegalia massiliensis]